MAKAKKLPSGNWRALVYAGKGQNGKRRYKSFTALTERKANLAAMEWQEHYKAVCSDASNMTVSEAIEKHIASKSNILSPSTIAGYHRSKKRLKKFLNIKLSKITSKMMNDEINIQLAKYSNKTVYNDFGLLRTVLKKYRPDFQIKIDIPVVYPTITKIPLDEDLRKIYAVAYGTEMEILILLASWLGLRVSEIRGLKCSKIANDRIIIDEAIVRGDNGDADKGPKSKKSVRVISMPAYIQKRINAVITDGREYITSLSGEAIYKRFVTICKKAGVGPFRFHDLRHTNATIMLEENVPDKYIAERGGWGSDIYKKRYEHTVISKQRSVSDAIDKHFEKLVQHEMQHDGVLNK